MTTFIIWSKTDDAAFRTRYLEVTGEAVQESPLESETQYMVASSRITAAQLALLQQEFSVATDGGNFVAQAAQDV